LRCCWRSFPKGPEFPVPPSSRRTVPFVTSGKASFSIPPSSRPGRIKRSTRRGSATVATTDPYRTAVRSFGRGRSTPPCRREKGEGGRAPLATPLTERGDGEFLPGRASPCGRGGAPSAPDAIRTMPQNRGRCTPAESGTLGARTVTPPTADPGKASFERRGAPFAAVVMHRTILPGPGAILSRAACPERTV